MSEVFLKGVVNDMMHVLDEKGRPLWLKLPDGRIARIKWDSVSDRIYDSKNNLIYEDSRGMVSLRIQSNIMEFEDVRQSEDTATNRKTEQKER